MTPTTTALRLRPLPLSELLDELFRMYRRNFLLMVTAALALELPALTFNLLSGQYKTFGFFLTAFSSINNPDRLDAIAPPQTNYLYLVIGYVVILMLLPVTTGLLVRLTTDVAMGRPTTFASAFRRTLRRYLALAAYDLLVGLAALAVVAVLLLVIFGGIALASASTNANAAVIVATVLIALAVFVASMIAAAWLGIRLVVAVPAMLEEGLGPIAAVRRSWRLVQGNFWRIVGIVVVVYVLAQVVQSALSAVFGLLALLIPGLSGDARGGLLLVALTAVQVITAPILAIAISLLYFDLRVRKDAFELDQLAGAVSPLPPPVPRASPLPPPIMPPPV